MMTPKDLWERTQADLQVSLSAGNYKMWIKNASIAEAREVGEERAIVVLTSVSSYHVTMLENRFYAQIKEALDRVSKRNCELQFKVTEQKTSGTNLQESNSHPTESDKKSQYNERAPQPSLFTPQAQTSQYDHVKQAVMKAGLREDYTFETFAVSTSNEMAHAAAVAVSQNPGHAYNPLFLYGGVGVGKTHLMQAVGHNIVKKDPTTPIAYITGEQFTNEIVAAIQQKRTIQLKNRLRNYRVLLVDDIQFIAGKESVQEEFFHTFNAIAPVGGQIILTSDRPPQEIHPLEDRLKSRFEAGLIIDIQEPTFELRTAILLIKAQKIGLELPMDFAQRIASVVESTRKLEGVLAKIHSEHSLFHKPLTAELIEEVVGKTQTAEFPKQLIKPQDVLRVVALQFHITTKNLKGPSRIKHLVEARHLAMFLLHTDLGVTLEEIGMMFDGRDHTSVLHAVEKMRTLLLENEDIRNNVNAVKATLSFSRSSDIND